MSNLLNPFRFGEVTAPQTNLAHWYTFRLSDVTLFNGITQVSARVGSQTIEQSDDAFKPDHNTSGINSLPTADHVASNTDKLFSPSTFTTINEPYVVAIAFEFGALDGGGGMVISDNQVVGFEFGHDGTDWQLTADAMQFITGSTADTNAHYVVCRMNGSSSEIRLDGSSDATGDIGTGSLSEIHLAGEAISGSYSDLQMGEILIYTGDKSGSALTELETYLGRWLP